MKRSRLLNEKWNARRNFSDTSASHICAAMLNQLIFLLEASRENVFVHLGQQRLGCASAIAIALVTPLPSSAQDTIAFIECSENLRTHLTGDHDVNVTSLKSEGFRIFTKSNGAWLNPSGMDVPPPGFHKLQDAIDSYCENDQCEVVYASKKMSPLYLFGFLFHIEACYFIENSDGELLTIDDSSRFVGNF